MYGLCADGDGSIVAVVFYFSPGDLRRLELLPQREAVIQAAGSQTQGKKDIYKNTPPPLLREIPRTTFSLRQVIYMR